MRLKTQNDRLTLLAEDIKWLTADSVGIFLSNRGHTDTLRMESYEESFHTGDVYGQSSKDAAFQITRCDVIRRKDKILVMTMCLERIDQERVDVYLKFEIMDPNSKGENRDFRFINRQLVPTPVIIDSTDYGECLVIDNWDSDNLMYYMREKGHNIDKAIWSKEHGLEYYRFEDGEEFTRIPD